MRRLSRIAHQCQCLCKVEIIAICSPFAFHSAIFYCFCLTVWYGTWNQASCLKNFPKWLKPSIKSLFLHCTMLLWINRNAVELSFCLYTEHLTCISVHLVVHSSMIRSSEILTHVPDGPHHHQADSFRGGHCHLGNQTWSQCHLHLTLPWAQFETCCWGDWSNAWALCEPYTGNQLYFLGILPQRMGHHQPEVEGWIGRGATIGAMSG